MNVCITGYLPEEGRHSIVRTARSICGAMQPMLDSGDTVRLLEGKERRVAAALDYRGLGVKLRKRLLLPMRLRVTPCDVLHVIDSDYAAGIPEAKLGRSIVTCHDLMPCLISDSLDQVFPTSWGRRFFEQSMRNLARCARVICVSEFTRATVLRYTECPPENVGVIVQAVDPAFRPLAEDDAGLLQFRARHGLRGKRIILHVGSAEAYKNVETVFEVMRLLRQRIGPELVLLKVGGAYTAKQQDLLNAAGLRDAHKHLLGLSEAELVQAYNSADLLLWPSHFEGFGLPVLEAMACGTPVVCSNGGALPEVASGAAVLAGATDADNLYESCCAILEDDGLAQSLRERGMEHARKFTWEKAAQAYYAEYKKLA